MADTGGLWLTEHGATAGSVAFLSLRAPGSDSRSTPSPITIKNACMDIPAISAQQSELVLCSWLSYTEAFFTSIIIASHSRFPHILNQFSKLFNNFSIISYPTGQHGHLSPAGLPRLSVWRFACSSCVWGFSLDTLVSSTVRKHTCLG